MSNTTLNLTQEQLDLGDQYAIYSGSQYMARTIINMIEKARMNFDRSKPTHPPAPLDYLDQATDRLPDDTQIKTLMELDRSQKTLSDYLESSTVSENPQLKKDVQALAEFIDVMKNYTRDVINVQEYLSPSDFNINISSLENIHERLKESSEQLREDIKSTLETEGGFVAVSYKGAKRSDSDKLINIISRVDEDLAKSLSADAGSHHLGDSVVVKTDSYEDAQEIQAILQTLFANAKNTYSDLDVTSHKNHIGGLLPMDAFHQAYSGHVNQVSKQQESRHNRNDDLDMN